ncbi:rho-associated protein kinase 1, partial [Biomphalaria glabrata]
MNISSSPASWMKGTIQERMLRFELISSRLTQKLEHCEIERSNLNQTIQELKTMIVHLENDKEAGFVITAGRK